MSACPTCGKPVDALRARNVKVREGKVVAYCSPECLASAESMPVKVPRATPAQGVVKPVPAVDSGPVIEIQYEPASGVVTSAKDERANPTPAPAKAETSKVDAKKEVFPKVDLVKLEKRAKSEPAEPKAETKADKTDKVETSGPIEVVAKAQEGLDRTPTGARKRGRDTMARDDSNAGQAVDWLDDEPANVGEVRAGTDVGVGEPPRSLKKVFVTLFVLALLAGAAVVAYKFLYQESRGSAAKATNRGSSASGSQPAGTGSGGSATPTGSDTGSALRPRVVGPQTGQVDDLPSVDQLRERAIAVLERHLASKDSPRVQRMAAMALSRTGNAAAKTRLVTALDKDKLEEAGRLEVAYALARAGDKRGLDALAASLTAPRRDDKLGAGRLLVQLGDKRAIDTLASYLEVPQNRLGAAEQLARVNEPRGIKVLEQIRADAKASTDDKARATIALGYAGKDVVDDLHALLANPHFNTGAADALATRHDEAARPVLEKLLEVSSLRVAAARGLRLLAPERDQTPQARTLLAALDDPKMQKDVEQILIAEAILLLAGPKEWADRP